MAARLYPPSSVAKGGRRAAGAASVGDGAGDRWDRWWRENEPTPATAVNDSNGAPVSRSDGAPAGSDPVGSSPDEPEPQGTFAFHVPGPRVTARARLRLTA